MIGPPLEQARRTSTRGIQLAAGPHCSPSQQRYQEQG